MKRFTWETNVIRRKPEDAPPANLAAAKNKEAKPQKPESLPRNLNGQLNLGEIRRNLAEELRESRRKVRR